MRPREAAAKIRSPAASLDNPGSLPTRPSGYRCRKSSAVQVTGWGTGLDPAKALKDSYSVMARKRLKAKKPTKAPPTPVVIPPAAGTEGLR